MIYKDYEDIPLIKNAKCFEDQSYIITFSNGEERICDLTESFSIPAALEYSAALYKSISFDSYSVWFGDRDRRDCMEIGHDSLYNMSVPSKTCCLSIHMDKVADEIRQLAIQILEYSISDRCDTLTKYIENVTNDMCSIKLSVINKQPIPIKDYKSKISSINKTTDSFQTAGRVAVDYLEMKPNSKTVISYCNDIRKCISQYRNTVLELNRWVILYNQLNIGEELKPLASADVSTL